MKKNKRKKSFSITSIFKKISKRISEAKKNIIKTLKELFNFGPIIVMMLGSIIGFGLAYLHRYLPPTADVTPKNVIHDENGILVKIVPEDQMTEKFLSSGNFMDIFLYTGICLIILLVLLTILRVTGVYKTT